MEVRDLPQLNNPISKVKTNWCFEEIKVLLRSWKAHSHIKRQLNKKLERQFCNAIREELQLHGFNRTVTEIREKIIRLLYNYRKDKQTVFERGCLVKSWYFLDLVEIEKLELENGSMDTDSEEDFEVASGDKDEEIMEEEIDPVCIEVMEDILQNVSLVSDSTAESFSENNHAGEKEPIEDITEVSSESNHLPKNDLQLTTEDVLLTFYKSFQKATSQLKENDALLLSLLREQNDIFKTQSALLKKLI